MGNYQHLYQELVSRLRAVRRKEVLLSFSAGLLWAIAIGVLLLVVATAIEAFAFAGTVVRSILFFACVLGALAAFAWFAVPPLLRVLGVKDKMLEDEIAMRVGKKYPDVDDRLTNALQLYRLSAQPMGMSEELALATFGSVGERARTLDFSVIINREEQKRGLLAFLFALVVAGIGFGIFSSSMSAALYRLQHFNQAFIPPAPFSLSIEPHKAQVLRGASTAIVVRVAGKFPYDYVNLHVREEQQEEFDSYTVRPDSAGDYRFEMPAIKRSVEFYASVPWYTESIRSEQGSIAVLDKPDIRSLSGTVTSPQYTRLAARTIDENSADVVALRGSAVRLNIISNKDLRSAEIVLLKKSGVMVLSNAGDSTQTTAQEERVDTVAVRMTTDGRQASGSFAVQFNGEYFIRITDTNGQSNGEPIHYSVAMLSDGLPTIALVEPTVDVELGENAILPVRVVITDDYGFSSLKLKYRLVESQYAEAEEKYTAISIPLPSAVLATEVPYVWDVNSIGISPQDKYEFYIEVTDNDVVSGPKSARTGLITLRLPSLDEIFQKAEQTQEVAQKDLQQILKEAEEVRKDLDEVARELRKQQQQQKNKLDWKEQKKIEDVLKKQEEFREKMEDVRQQLAEMAEQLKDNQAISPETMQKYSELQELMKKVDAPELRQRQQQMQKALEQMSPQQMEQAIKDFKFDEENFRKSIERTMKILQRTQAEQKTDELTKRAQELQEKQSELQKEMANTNPNDKKKMDELAKKQQQLQDELDKLNKELKDLEELMKKVGDDMPMDDMQKAMEELQKEETEQAMQQAQQQMQQGNMEKAQQQQKKAQQNLKNFAQQMQKMKQQMQKKNTQEAIRQMRKSVQDMINLSKQQEQMKEDAKSMDYNSAQFREQAQKQSEALQDLNNIAGNLMQLSEKSFSVTPEMGKEIGDAMRQMQQAMEQLTNRNAQGASKSQGEAMGSMNRSIMQMQQALSRMQGQGQGQGQGEGEGQGQGQNGMGFMQRLQQMAMQQQMLNQGMQQLMQQGGQMSQQQRDELGRMAGQQSRLQKSMEQLAKEQKESGGEKKALGDLDRLASEMQEIVSDMRTGKIDDETVQRQERILSRLLDATRSTRERDYEKQRESQSGKNVARQSPKELDLDTQEGRNKALQDLLRSIQQGYTKDYEAIIRRYFEALQHTGSGQ